MAAVNGPSRSSACSAKRGPIRGSKNELYSGNATSAAPSAWASAASDRIVSALAPESGPGANWATATRGIARC